ncbi:MAG: efflux RND transporter permease subunit [Kiritimatiellia bacterium]|nr:efflux RND transporter permease subunit [Kiritimatiellia bacterium]
MTAAEKAIDGIRVFSRVFIERPRLALVISIILTIAGVMAMVSLPVSQYPRITPPQVTVTATYPGANAQEVAKTVATPIEEEVNGVDDMLYMSSSCTDDGRYQLTVTFAVGTDRDMNMVRVQNRVAQAEPKLPSEVTQYGISLRAASSDMLGFVALISPHGTHSRLDLSDYIYTSIRPVLLRVPGVGEANVYGPRVGVRVWLDPQRMAAMGMNSEEVVAAIRQQNIQASLGTIGAAPAGDGSQLSFSLIATGRLSSPQDFEEIVVRSEAQGGLVRIKDIGRVQFDEEIYGFSAYFNGGEAVSIALQQKPGANAIETMNQIYREFEELKKKFPEDMELVIPYDATTYVRVCIQEIISTLLITFVLVVLVCYLFLQDWRATLVPSLTIPVSLCATFLVMALLGYSINTLTLFGLVLAIGTVVDDAIVVVERTQFLMETRGLSSRYAAIQAMSDVTGAVIATTLVLLGIFVPIAFLGGMTGQIYQQFAVALSAAVCFSTVNALTLSPAVCAVMLRKPEMHERGPFGWFNRFIRLLQNCYISIAGGLARRKALSGLLLVSVVLCCVFFLQRIPTSFLPDEDQGVLFITSQLQEGTTLPKSYELTQRATQVALTDTNNVRSLLGINGMSLLGGRAESLSSLILDLRSWDERPLPEQHVSSLIRKYTGIMNATLPESKVQVFIPPAIPGLGANGGVDVRLESLRSTDPHALDAILQECLVKLNQQPEILAAFSSYTAKTPKLRVHLDRTKAELYQVPVATVFSTLQNYLGSRYVNDINLGTLVNKVKVQSDWIGRAKIEDVLRLYVKSNTGAMVPMGSLITIEKELGPRLVDRFNLYPSAAITIMPKAGVPSGEVMKATRRVLDATLNNDYNYEWAGLSYQENKTGNQAIWLVLLAIVFGYLFLVAQYESWTIPLPVMLSIFVAALGSLMGLKYSGQALSIYAQLGMLLLVGLSSKNAILIVEFAKTKREEGLSIIEAAKAGAGERLRAVLMTALTCVLGMVPMAIATGAGAASRQAIGITVLWGMTLSTCVGILLVPGLYAIFQWLRERAHAMVGAPLPETLRDRAVAAGQNA